MMSGSLYLSLMLFIRGALGVSHLCPFLTGVDPIEKELGALKLKFVGVTPTVHRIPTEGPSKVVIKKYSATPSMEEVDGTLVVKTEACAAGAPEPAPAPGPSGSVTSAPGTVAATTTGQDEETSSAFGLSNPSLLAMTTATLAAMKRCPVLGLSAGILAAVSAQAQESCAAAMEVEVHIQMTQADVDAFIAKKEKTGQFKECPAETVYHEFHSDVHGGYKGCAADTGLNPCSQDGFGGSSMAMSAADGGLNKKYIWNATTNTCMDTGRSWADEIFWILWGHPMDTHELLKRTGSNPTVYFPLERAGYPTYNWGGSHGSEELDAHANDKEYLEWMGFATKSELAQFKVTMTEGTEAGMGQLYAAMMAHIAQTSCNRKIYLHVEAPTYGYDMGAAVALANTQASSFYNSSECTCFATDTCKTGSITLTRVGWFPGQPLPKRTGDDGLEYDVSSTSAKSPWFERMVWPENPTGETRTAQGPTNRLLCDGCYVFPMYFKGGQVPGSSKPQCAGWAFSMTKAYSATVRAGTMLTLKDHPWDGVVDKIASHQNSMANGLYSEWSWKGMIQIKNFIMSKPISDKTSWFGAYTEIMQEKWDIMSEAIGTCSFLELANGPALTGAYLWIKKTGDYRCLNKGWMDSFFKDCVGVETTSYNFGFRGTTASDYYGEGYCNDDFTRIQLYRDVNVYKEVAKRLKTVCAGGAVEHSAGKFLTAAEWKASKEAGRRRLEETGTEPATVEERARHLRDAVPRLTEKEAAFFAEGHHQDAVIQKKLDEFCEPRGYPMDCLFEHTGHNKPDVKIQSLV